MNITNHSSPIRLQTVQRLKIIRRKYLAEKEKYGDHDQIAKCITLMERGTFSEDLNPPPGLGNDKVVDGFFSAELNNE